MLINKFSLSGFRLSRVSGGCLVLADFVLTLVFISCVSAASQSDRVVAQHQKEFYEAWLRRELRGNELREVTDEFIAYYTKQGKDRAGMHEVAGSFDIYSKLLREHDATPAAFTTRHSLLVLNYFDPGMQNTTELRLLNEPDPVRVVDPSSKRLMTERDVVALANIYNFARSEGAPRHSELSRQEIDRLVTELDRAYGNHQESGQLPQFFGETAAFWAGVRQEWPRLSDEEKRKARAYADKTYKSLPPVQLYAKLWGLDSNAASKRYLDDVSACLVYINEVNMQSIVLHKIMEKVASW